jgi:SulP family sulfate permease
MGTTPRPFDGVQDRNWPIFRSLAAYRFAFLPQDLVAGLTLAAIAIPEQMATARLAGVQPEIGLFGFVAGSVGFAIFGNSRVLSCGADSTIAPIFAGSLATLAASGSANYAALAAALALMVGMWLVAGSCFRLGWIADLLSVPVMTGFLAGIGIHILVWQFSALLGQDHQSNSIIRVGISLVTHPSRADAFAVTIGLGVLIIIAISERINARLPGALIGLVIATAAVSAFDLDAHGVPVIGAIADHWPSISIPSAPISRLVPLIPLSLLIAFVVMIQTAATTRSFPSNPDIPPDVDRDYLGVGAGSILASLVGAFPLDASPPRTAIVAAASGHSQIAGLAAAVLVIALFIFGAHLLTDVPDAALSGVLFFVGLRLIRIPEMASIFRQSSGEFLLAVTTSAAVVLLPIEQGVSIGIVLSLFHGIWSTTRAHPIVFERVPATSIWWPPNPELSGESLPNVLVVAFQAPLSFLNAYIFRRDVLALLQEAREPIRLLVLESSAILNIDFTAAQMLKSLIRYCQDEGIIFAVARLESLRAQEATKRFGVDKVLGPGRVFHSVDEAIKTLMPLC